AHPQRLETYIGTVLRPWRSENLRKLAIQVDSDILSPLLLRTLYNADKAARAADDAQLAEWVGMDELFADEAWWACLDDAELFNYGDHWEKVFEILPELANPRLTQDESTRPSFPPLDSEIGALRRARASLKEAKPHHVYTANYVIIVDREAFETGHALIVYVDSRRNVVREARFEVILGSFEEIMLDWFDMTLTPWLWEDSEVGEKYRLDGEFAQEIYQLIKDDWEDINGYTMKKWSSDSTESPDEQRLRLIREHLDSDTIPESDLMMQNCPEPSSNDIDTIFRPLRFDKLRKAALRVHGSCHVPLILRTYYNSDKAERSVDDIRFAEWIRLDELLADEADWACLDDPELFDFGDQWERIFELVPELTSHPSSEDYLKTVRPKFPPLDSEISPSDIHFTCTANHLIILDLEAFETGHACIVYPDNRRNIVRQTRFEIVHGCFEEILLDWFDIVLTDWLWEDSEVGEKYRVDGEFGQEIYQLTAADWEDPSEGWPVVNLETLGKNAAPGGAFEDDHCP
ncbi:hypothetical protein N7488_006952, partial [Penicillium malachiteum]